MNQLEERLIEILPIYTELLGIHEAAGLWPMPTQDEYDALVKSVHENGQLEKIRVESGTGLLIDGRSRLMACYDAQVEPRFESTTLDPWIVSIGSETRRSTTTGQKAMAALKLKAHFAEEAKERQVRSAENRENSCSGNITLSETGRARDAAAARVGISGSSVDKAAFIANESDEVAAQVTIGEITLEKGLKAAKQIHKQSLQTETPAEDKETVIVFTPEGLTTEIGKPKKPVFNKTNENVDWAGYTWNPVTGCRHGCKFCYAEGISKMKRMQPSYPFGFEPTFHTYRLDAPKNTKPDGRVFVCSMADLFGKWIPDAWIQKVFDACMEAPEWEYLFLTKWPNRYKMLAALPRAWFGASIIKQADVARVHREMMSFSTTGIKWISLEPMLEHIELGSNISEWCDVVVIGSQTAANGEPAIAPYFDWVVDVVNECRAQEVMYYLKPNLMEIKPGMTMPRNLPTLLL